VLLKPAETLPDDGGVVAQVEPAEGDFPPAFLSHRGQAVATPTLRLPTGEIVEGFLEVAFVPVIARQANEGLLARVERVHEVPARRSGLRLERLFQVAEHRALVPALLGEVGQVDKGQGYPAVLPAGPFQGQEKVFSLVEVLLPEVETGIK